jgi:ParB family chromosome partitioning protein
MVSEKTGFSARQIHQAIDRDEKASDEIKEARRNGELAISHTNEIIKLDKEHQGRAYEHLRNRPVRDVKKFVKLAKARGFDEAVENTPTEPHAREFQEIEKLAKKLKKQFELLEMEGISFLDLPEKTQKLMSELSANSSFIRPQKPSSAPASESFSTH